MQIMDFAGEVLHCLAGTVRQAVFKWTHPGRIAGAADATGERTSRGRTHQRQPDTLASYRCIVCSWQVANNRAQAQHSVGCWVPPRVLPLSPPGTWPGT